MLTSTLCLLQDHDIPEKWKAAQKSCLDLHTDWEYKLWTDADCLRFIEVSRWPTCGGLCA